MRRVSITFMAICLGAIGTAHGVAAQSPSPDPTPTPATVSISEGQRTEATGTVVTFSADRGVRVELPGTGITLTFPHDWTLETRPTSRSVGLASVLDPDSQALMVPLVAAVPGHRHDHCVVVDFAPLVRARADWSTLADVMAGFEAMLGSDPRWVGLDSVVINLPAGPVGRILRDRAGESESVHTYVFTRADAWLYLECVVHSDPSGVWRSIAQTFEFLPVAE